MCADPVLRLTDAGVPPEDVPVEDVEGEVAEAARDFAVEVFTVEWAAVGEKQRETFTIGQDGHYQITTRVVIVLSHTGTCVICTQINLTALRNTFQT